MVSVFKSVGALIYDAQGRLLLQKRDEKKTIYFPGLWGTFGGAYSSPESPHDAIIREVREELSVSVRQLEFFIKLTSESECLGLREKTFYEILFNDEMKKSIDLQEGAGYCFFDAARLPPPTQVVPFDLAAVILFSHVKLARRQVIPDFGNDY